MFKKYYELSKPGIIYGNLLTAVAGYFLASRYHPHWIALLGIIVGVSGIIGAACVCNNVLDRDIDANMKRTSTRATVTGTISTRNAQAYAAVLLVIGSLALFFTTHLLALIVALVAAVLYVGVYTPLKRRTAYSALIGSIPGASPPVIGYVALTGHLDLTALILFVIMVCWQMPHFYAISIYRKEEYTKAGVPVFSIEKGIARTKREIVYYLIGFLLSTIALYAFGYTGIFYIIGMIAAGVVWLGFVLQGFQKGIDDPKWARKVFLFSLIVITVFSILISVNPQ